MPTHTSSKNLSKTAADAEIDAGMTPKQIAEALSYLPFSFHNSRHTVSIDRETRDFVVDCLVNRNAQSRLRRKS